MSSPHSRSEQSADRSEVSDTNTARKSQRTEMRRRRAQQSPFKVSDSISVYLQNTSERGDQKEEMRKFLALPIEEKTTHAARTMAKLKNELVGDLEEEAYEKKILKQIQRKTVLPKQTSSIYDLKTSSMKGENLTKESKHDLVVMERQKAVLELSLMTKRSEILRMDKAIAKEERKLKHLERTIERDNQTFEEFLRENERKSVEARTLFEQEEKTKQEKNIEIKRLTADIGTIKSEIASFEETLIDYMRYKEFLFKISPPEWQQEQKLRASKLKVLSGRDGQEPHKVALMDGSGSRTSASDREESSDRETGPPPAPSDTQEGSLTLNVDSLEDEAELYFTDPHQLLDLMTELTEQNLFLIQNSARVEEVLKELRQSTETTGRKIEKEEEEIALEIKEINKKINKEKARSSVLQQMVQLHRSLGSEDEDLMLDALSEKVTEVHSICVHDRMTNLSTLEKVANIEKRVFSLLQSLESIPEERLEVIKKVKDSEKRSRQREEKLIEQKEKQKERMRRYLERSLADSKKISGRKLMPRCMPVVQRVRIPNEDTAPTEDDTHEFGSDTE